MVDVLTLEQRSYNMSVIRGENTAPETAVRRLPRSLGYAGRYRINVRTLSGCPDIVLPKVKAVIFVHGGYGHMHKCPLGVVRPKTNEELRKEWSVLTVWERQRRMRIDSQRS
jgi:DNA mismatch endonuclease (patch repair protein)